MEIVKNVVEIIGFMCNSESWRMAVLWTISLVFSHLKLLYQSLLSQKSKCYHRSSLEDSNFATAMVPRLVCIITGVTWVPLFFEFFFYCFLELKFMDMHSGSTRFLLNSAVWCSLQATSGLGAAAAYALSKEGFFVVLGNLFIVYKFARKPSWMNIENLNLFVYEECFVSLPIINFWTWFVIGFS